MEEKKSIMRRITIKIEKEAKYYYDAERKLLIPIYEDSKRSVVKENTFKFYLQMVLPYLSISTKHLIAKTLHSLQPMNVIAKVLERKGLTPKHSLINLIQETEFVMLKEISSKILGADEDPTKIYEFLSKILIELSKELEKVQSQYYALILEELKKKEFEL
ncbi:MAG: hypothetical protein ACK4UJ_00785 [Leptonema sp. (in: bacteria)]